MSMSSDRKRQYFAELAPSYAANTGNATQELFNELLRQRDLKITNESIIHDNAAGPGTATEAILNWADSCGLTPRIVTTDYADGMIKNFEELLASKPAWQDRVETQVCDSADLSAFKDDFFTHSINSFSIFVLDEPIKSIREMYRTLKPGGLAIHLTWKHFGVSDILDFAQDYVKGQGWADNHRVPINGAEYLQEGYQTNKVKEAGFDPDKIEELALEYRLKPGKYWDGVAKFFKSSSIAAGSTKDWSEEEKQKWPDAIEKGMEHELETHGGIRFDTWVTLAVK